MQFGGRRPFCRKLILKTFLANVLANEGSLKLKLGPFSTAKSLMLTAFSYF